MVRYIISLVVGCTISASVVTGSPAPPKNLCPAAKALLRQANGLAQIKTIHFLATGKFKTQTKQGKRVVASLRYEFWGAGAKYRIDFQQFAPQADFDILVTDNGKHFCMLNRISDVLRIGPSHPTHGGTPVMQNPILEPLIPLAPYFPRRLGTPHTHWINFARFARNPRSIFDRCRKVTLCNMHARPGWSTGCLSGMVEYTPAKVQFAVDGVGSHSLVASWTATESRYPGAYMSMASVQYHTFQLPSGKTIFLPGKFRLVGVLRPIGAWRGAFTRDIRISNVSLDKPIAPDKFTIDYKLARYIVDVTPDGKFHYISGHPDRPAPGRNWELKNGSSSSH